MSNILTPQEELISKAEFGGWDKQELIQEMVYVLNIEQSVGCKTKDLKTGDTVVISAYKPGTTTALFSFKETDGEVTIDKDKNLIQLKIDKTKTKDYAKGYYYMTVYYTSSAGEERIYQGMLRVTGKFI